MRKTALFFAFIGATSLAGCMQTDGQRALVGAGTGALIADATDQNMVAGAALGAGAGALCDDAGVCSRSRR
ncbi:hypothetical protein ERN12_00405 [Rhodobacteraceae bacterium]|nr:hypothetical protein ERN12_00405 [Paracoccaceae bacterium]